MMKLTIYLHVLLASLTVLNCQGSDVQVDQEKFQMLWNQLDKPVVHSVQTLLSAVVDNRIRWSFDGQPPEGIVLNQLIDDLERDQDPSSSVNNKDTLALYKALVKQLQGTPEEVYLKKESKNLDTKRLIETVRKNLLSPCMQYVNGMNQNVFDNQLLQGPIDKTAKDFYRAWTYFNLCRKINYNFDDLLVEMISLANKKIEIN